MYLSNIKQTTINTEENDKAIVGTELLLSSLNILGPYVCELNENSCLLETYIPEFAADKTEVNITTFIIIAAKPKPIF